MIDAMSNELKKLWGEVSNLKSLINKTILCNYVKIFYTIDLVESSFPVIKFDDNNIFIGYFPSENNVNHTELNCFGGEDNDSKISLLNDFV